MAGPYPNGNGTNYANIQSWGIIASIVIALVSMFWAAVNPHTDMAELRKELLAEIHGVEAKDKEMNDQERTTLTRYMDGRVTKERFDQYYADERDEHNADHTIIENRLPKSTFEEYAKRVDKEIDVITGEITRLRSDQVPRSEHMKQWADTQAEISALQASISELRKEYVGIYSDQVKTLQAQLEALRQRFDATTRDSRVTVQSPIQLQSPNK
jgi:hypothetical protein